ncbi:hypothetical protein, partial [Salmonella enterica]|uniref:hypothetical protein n=1 Tax=Salmonella enterica TaxID=28901 RepID=UPI00398C7412
RKRGEEQGEWRRGEEVEEERHRSKRKGTTRPMGTRKVGWEEGEGKGVTGKEGIKEGRGGKRKRVRRGKERGRRGRGKRERRREKDRDERKGDRNGKGKQMKRN